MSADESTGSKGCVVHDEGLMPYIETPDELAEWFADRIGLYGAHDEKCDGGLKTNMCRVCWVPMIADRIRESVKNEAQVQS